MVFGKCEVPGWGPPEVIGEAAAEVVVVDEDDVQFHLKQFGWNRAVETVEPEVQEHQPLGLKHLLWELPRQLVVAEVQLVEKAEVADGKIWELTAEVVGVDVEECQLWNVAQDIRQPQFFSFAHRDGSLVQVYSRNGLLP